MPPIAELIDELSLDNIDLSAVEERLESIPMDH